MPLTLGGRKAFPRRPRLAGRDGRPARPRTRLRAGSASPTSLTTGLLLLCCVLLSPQSFAESAAKPPNFLLLDATLAGNDIIAVGERGAVLLSTDHAQSWRPLKSPTRATLTGISFAPSAASGTAHPGWAVGHDALILASTDSGRTWTKQFQGENLQDSFLDVLALDAQRVIAVGAYGLFVASNDGGKTWSRRKLSDDDFHFNRITRGPTGTLYLAGERGTLLRSSDSGATWTPLRAPYEGSFYGILPLNERTLLAHGLRGHVYRSTDDGATWTAVATPQPVLLATAVRTRDNVILLAGQARTLLTSRDDGQTFTAAAAAPATAIAELLPLANAAVLAVGEAGPALLNLPAPQARTP